jgi:dihydroorotate dehydrogenase
LLSYQDPILEQDVLGIHFSNPVGLAAGFDKNAELTNTIPSVGFGHMEVGSITAKPCTGNPKPRLWRLKKSQGLIVYYGLKNDGAEVIYNRLKDKKFSIPVSTSIAMTNCKENMDIRNAIADYVMGFKRFTELGSFFTVNVSCPNTVGGQPFMDSQNLDLLLTELDFVQTDKPVFVKLSPDVTELQVDAIFDVLRRHKVKGIICSNLTKPRNNKMLLDEDVPEKGGISGKPVQELSDKLLAQLYRKAPGRFVLIGCGGVFTAEDAYKKIRLGASLIHMVTGMIFEGPQVIGKINKGLAELLRRDGFKNISDAIGVDNT